MYPEKLVSYIEEKESDGCEIFITNGADSTVFLIKERGLEKWVTFIEWFQSDEDFSLVNISGKSFDRLMLVMNECINGVNQ